MTAPERRFEEEWGHYCREVAVGSAMIERGRQKSLLITAGMTPLNVVSLQLDADALRLEGQLRIAQAKMMFLAEINTQLRGCENIAFADHILIIGKEVYTTK